MNKPHWKQEIVHKELNHESFPIFTLYLIYLEVSEKSIPRKMFWNIDDWLKKTANEVKSAWEFFEICISEITDIKILEKIENDFEYILSHKKISDWVIIYWKKLLELLDAHIAEIESKKLLKATVSQVVVDIEICLKKTQKPKVKEIKKVFSRNISLKDWIFNFDTWEDIFWNYIEFFEKTINTKWLKQTKEISDFIKKLKPENRWNKNVFTKIDDFFETFWFIKFYEYLLSFLSNWKNNKILAIAILENFPIFEIQTWNQEDFLKLQQKVLDKALELTNWNAK